MCRANGNARGVKAPVSYRCNWSSCFHHSSLGGWILVQDLGPEEGGRQALERTGAASVSGRQAMAGHCQSDENLGSDSPEGGAPHQVGSRRMGRQFSPYPPPAPTPPQSDPPPPTQPLQHAHPPELHRFPQEQSPGTDSLPR